MLYLLLFACTTFLFFVAQKLYLRSIPLFYVLSYFAIFLLSFFAGIRDNTIGTDIHVYGIKVYNVASNSTNFWKAYHSVSSVSELFYFIINYISALIYDKYGLSLFLQMFIQSTLVFLGMKRYISNAPLWLTMLIYQMLFYNLTLNLMRQGIAIAFIFWSFKYLERQKVIYFCICAFLSFFFHKTGLIASTILLMIYWALQNKEWLQKIFLFTAICISIVCVHYFTLTIKLLSHINPLFSHFLAYAEGTDFYANVSTMDILMRFAFTFIALFFYKNPTINKTQVYILLFLLIVDFASLSLGRYAFFATRFSYYFLIIEIPYIITLIHSGKLTLKTQYIANIILISFFIYYYARFILINDENETSPYKSEILFIN